ncbi:glycoside hydrolase family 13 protein [Nocardioides sp. cx-173]|uniref:glycoside hydrolase family 13 protein n=1 Tax=Nocardioides sp. cx-173 TaxID=2898796 RepID=UPI001E45FF11|nr:glycoside hydrolase family 13 protein [Nocardioides sp. cx-173]MCD4523977.1 glycoside hydrolase family 13 protein [Nocardioides sp. cx-173]UGB41380.1 glycoside hydrolase family 13 protein [Nocardioides sp. cx-173]
MSGREWWRQAVVYQVYVRSFADSDGDGVGDLPGITSRLPYLRDLGVDAVWVTPFYRSPQHDHGYDVADYTDVDPLFGTLADADALVSRAHDLGLKVIVDLVPNHTSHEHAWFQAAMAARPGSPERARYLFRTGRGADAGEPPNNWLSVFGGPAWTRVGDTDQWHLHLFDSTQPDLDWRNPEVAAMFADVLRFWLDRDVDGFRVDVAHGLLKEESLRDQRGQRTEVDHFEMGGLAEDAPMWDQPEVHEVYRQWHRILAEYAGDRMAVAEAWTSTVEANAAYVRPDELHQAFNFDWVLAPWSAPAFAEVIERTLPAMAAVGGTPTWVLSNHDVQRHATRYGGGAVGRARARAATLLSLTLPGSAYLYQGEELGLEDVEVAPEHRQDPSWFRTGQPGRDGCRVPMPWSGDRPPYGFGPGTGQPWIPQPDDWAPLTVAAQEADPASTLAFYRRALALRREWLRDAGDDVTLTVLDDVLTVRRGQVTLAVNCGSRAAPLPAGETLLATGPADGGLPPDTAIWVRTS